MSISLVQQTAAGIINATSGTTTLNNVAAGDLLTILAAGANNAYTISSITDNLGNTWSKAAQSNVNADVEVWYASNVKAGNTTVTITFSTAQYASWNFAEWSGVSGTVDVTATNNGGTSPATTGAINTTNANDLLVGLIGTESQNPGTFSDTGSSNGTPTGLDWDPNDDESGAAAYQIVSKTGNYEFSASTASYDTWDAAIVAFKAATASAISVSGNVSQGFSLRNAQTLSLTGALVERVAALVSSIQKTAAALASGSSLGASAIPQSSSTLPTGAALTGGEFTSAAPALSQTTETSAVAALEGLTGVASASVAAQAGAPPQATASLSASSAAGASSAASASAPAPVLQSAAASELVVAGSDAAYTQALAGSAVGQAGVNIAPGASLNTAALGALGANVLETPQTAAALNLGPLSASLAESTSGAANASAEAGGGLGASLGLSSQAALVAQVIELFATLAASSATSANVQAQTAALAELITQLSSTMTAPTIVKVALLPDADGRVAALLSGAAAGSAQFLSGLSALAIEHLAVSPSMTPAEITLAAAAATLIWKAGLTTNLVLELLGMLEESQAISTAAAQSIRVTVALRARSPLAPALIVEAPLSSALVFESALTSAQVLTSPLARAIALASNLSQALVITGAL